MPCIPKKTIELIVDSNNHYVAQVKKNQLSLYREIQKTVDQQSPLDCFQTHQRGHGRHTHWHCKVFEAKDNEQSKKWKALSRFISVRRINFDTKKKVISQTERFYISDLPDNKAEFFFKGIRGHWSIENSLHWVKDVIHNEDANRIQKANGPVNMAVISSIAINLGRKYGQWSMTENCVRFAANIEKAVKIIRT